MNILLWVLQIALAWLSIAGGYFQMFKLEKLQTNVAAMRELPHGLWALLGAFGCVAGLGLVLPGAINVRPNLTAFAAISVAVESVLISAFYLYYGDRSPLPYSVSMAIIAALIAYGRLVPKPF